MPLGDVKVLLAHIQQQQLEAALHIRKIIVEIDFC